MHVKQIYLIPLQFVCVFKSLKVTHISLVGKTLSYAVPMVEKLRSRPTRINRADGVYALILVPTRELALQTLAVLKKLLQVSDP